MDELLVTPAVVGRMMQYLDQSALARAIQVSKHWHATLVPYLWHTFGLLPPCTMRFGAASPPRGFFGVKFPLDSASQSKSPPMLALASDEIYPEGNFALGTGPGRVPDSGVFGAFRSLDATSGSMWRRLFTRQPFTMDEAIAMQTIVAKYAPHIQCLVVRSLLAFRILQPLCRNLRGFYLQLDEQDSGSEFTNLGWRQELREAKQNIIQFVLDQPHLHSLHLPKALAEPCELRDWIMCKRQDWQHADVMLSQEEYRHVNTLLPTVQSCRFRFADSSALSTPLDPPHLYMREVELEVDTFDHIALTGVAMSLPNLRRLVVRDTFCRILLDLTMNNGTALSLSRPLTSQQHEVARIIPLIPNLVALHIDHWVDEDYQAVAQYAPRLMYAFSMCLLSQVPEDSMARDTSPPPWPTAQLLLANCPELRGLEMADSQLHVSHIMQAPWVCKHLKSLRCRLIGVPRAFESEKDRYKEVSEKLKQLRERGLTWQVSSDHDRAMLGLIESRHYWRQVLREKLLQVPEATLNGGIGNFLWDLDFVP